MAPEKIYIRKNNVIQRKWRLISVVQADPEIPGLVQRQMIDEFIEFAKHWEKEPRIEVLTDLLGRIQGSSPSRFQQDFFQQQALRIRYRIAKLSGKKVEEPRGTEMASKEYKDEWGLGLKKSYKGDPLSKELAKEKFRQGLLRLPKPKHSDQHYRKVLRDKTPIMEDKEEDDAWKKIEKLRKRASKAKSQEEEDSLYEEYQYQLTKSLPIEFTIGCAIDKCLKIAAALLNRDEEVEIHEVLPDSEATLILDDDDVLTLFDDGEDGSEVLDGLTIFCDDDHDHDDDEPFPKPKSPEDAHK